MVHHEEVWFYHLISDKIIDNKTKSKNAQTNGTESRVPIMYHGKHPGLGKIPGYTEESVILFQGKTVTTENNFETT